MKRLPSVEPHFLSGAFCALLFIAIIQHWFSPTAYEQGSKDAVEFCKLRWDRWKSENNMYTQGRKDEHQQCKESIAALQTEWKDKCVIK